MNKEDMKYDGQVAIVTGAGGDIGREISIRLAGEGAAVGVVDVNLETANETREIIEGSGGIAIVLQTNVSDSGQVKKMVADILDRCGKIDILVKNAGIGIRSTLLDTSEELWDLIMQVDPGSVFRCTKYVAPEMIRQGGGRIINIASLMGMIGMGSPAYSAAKGGIIAMTPIVAAELGPHKITIPSPLGSS
jgi:3-oxoacyl-[acyl-carrier protein] reductase